MDQAAPRATLQPRRLTQDDAVDRAALLHLVAAYCHGIDRRDYALVADLYHPGAIDDHRPYFRGPVEDYVAWLPSMMANWRATSHVILNALFLVDGDRAEGEAAARAWHLTADGGRQFIAWGRYADGYERRDGVWRFARRSFILDFAEEVPVGDGDDFGVAGVDVASAGAEDPVYRRLPLFGADRQRRAGGRDRPDAWTR